MYDISIWSSKQSEKKFNFTLFHDTLHTLRQKAGIIWKITEHTLVHFKGSRSYVGTRASRTTAAGELRAVALLMVAAVVLLLRATDSWLSDAAASQSFDSPFTVGRFTTNLSNYLELDFV